MVTERANLVSAGTKNIGDHRTEVEDHCSAE
jgi:hypothetical protein